MSARSKSKSPFAERLAIAKQHLELTDKYIASVVGGNASSWQTYRHGTTSPGFLTIAKFADATGISLDWLATGEGPMLRADRTAPTSAQPQPSEDTLLREALKSLLRRMEG